MAPGWKRSLGITLLKRPPSTCKLKMGWIEPGNHVGRDDPCMQTRHVRRRGLPPVPAAPWHRERSLCAECGAAANQSAPLFKAASAQTLWQAYFPKGDAGGGVNEQLSPLHALPRRPRQRVAPSGLHAAPDPPRCLKAISWFENVAWAWTDSLVGIVFTFALRGFPACCASTMLPAT